MIISVTILFLHSVLFVVRTDRIYSAKPWLISFGSKNRKNRKTQTEKSMESRYFCFGMIQYMLKSVYCGFNQIFLILAPFCASMDLVGKTWKQNGNCNIKEGHKLFSYWQGLSVNLSLYFLSIFSLFALRGQYKKIAMISGLLIKSPYSQINWIFPGFNCVSGLSGYLLKSKDSEYFDKL